MINFSFPFLQSCYIITPIILYTSSTRNLIDIYDSISFFTSDEIES